MKIKASTCFLMFIWLAVAGAMFQSLTFRYAEDKILPLVVGGLILILGLIRLVGELHGARVKTAAKGKSEETSGTDAFERQHIVALFGWMVGCFLAICLLGFLVASPLFILAYLKRHGSNWLRTVTVALVTTAVIFAVFELVFRIELYRGLLFFWL